MAKGNVAKIYELRTLGYPDLQKQLEGVEKSFLAIKKAKQDANAAAVEAKRVQGEESQAFKDAKKAYDEARIAEVNLRTEKKNLTNEMTAANNVRQAEINQQKQAAAGAKVTAGSYAELYKQYRELYNLVKNTPKTGTLTFQGQTINYDDAITKLKSLAAAEQAFRRQFAADKTLVGEYTSGIVQAFKQMGLGDLVGGQVTKAKGRLQELNVEFDKLKAQYSQVKQAGTGGLDAIEKKMVENRQETIKLEQEVGRLRSELAGTGDIGNQITTSISNGFKSLKGQVGQFLLAYVGVQAALSQMQKFVAENAELSDSFAQLQIYIHGTEDDVNKLVESLKKIPTRTSLEKLVDIATVVAKKGVAKDEIAGVTESLDRLFVVLGKEIGDPHEAVSSLVKLVNVYSEDKHVTAKNINDIGAAIQKLTSSGVATGSFLISFAERLAGVRGITGVSIQNVLGLGAAIQELGQRSETAGTAASTLIVKLFADIPKYAGFAGKSVAEFTKTVTESPVEALIQLAEGLKKNKNGLDEVAQAFDSAGIHGARVLGVLGDIAGNADYMRRRVVDSNKAFGDQGSILAANEIKQKTFAATLDKIRKQFELIGTNRAVQITLGAIAAALYLILTNMVPILSVLALYGIGWLTVAKEIEVAGVATSVTNAQLLLQRAALIGNNILLGITRIYTLAATVAQSSYNAAMVLYTGVANRATAATILLGNATRLLPFGIILTVVALLVVSFKALGAGINGTTEALRQQARQALIMNDIYKKANEAVAQQTSTMAGWVAVLKSATSSLDTKRVALQKLIDMNDSFKQVLNGQIIDLKKLDDVYQSIAKSIRAKAEAEAASQLSAEKQKEVLNITAVRQKLETEFARTKGSFRALSGFTDDEIQKLFDNLDLGTVSLREGGGGKISFNAKDFSRIRGNLIRQENDAIAVYNDYVQAQAKTQERLVALETAAQDAEKAHADEVSKGFEIDIAALKQQIDVLDKQINSFQGKKSDLQKLVDERKKLQDELDKLLNKNQKQPHASKLTAEQKDAFKDYDAARDELLAKNETRFIRGTEDEETYLRNIYAINESAIHKKLKLIKGANAEERKTIAELDLASVKNERETNDKIFALRQDALQKTKNAAIQKAKEDNKLIQDDINKSATEKLKSQVDLDQLTLNLETKFMSDVDALEKELGNQSVKNVKDNAEAVRKAKEDLYKDEKQRTAATLKDMEDDAEKSIANFKAVIAGMRLTIAGSNKKQSKKDAALKTLDNQETIGVLAREVTSMQNELPIYKQLYAEGEITAAKYLAFVTLLQQKEKELSDALADGLNKNVKRITGIKDYLSSKIADLFNFKDGSDKGKLLAETLAQTYQLAGDAMASYFDRERAEIERQNVLVQSRLDIELKQRKARASSQAEEESLDRQFAARKEKADRDAFEKNKKLQIKQATINLATQLSNLAVIAFSPNPLNIATLGIAGTVMYAIQAALALAGYAINVGRIKSQTYEYGGVPSKGGKFGGSPHSHGGTPFMFKGAQYEAEVDELAIIRTKNAAKDRMMNLAGTHSQIASALNVAGGGVNFAPGAKIKTFDYGGNLGSSLQAPVFVPALSNIVVSNNGGVEDMLSLMIYSMTEQTKAINSRIDRLQVVQDTNTVTASQKKIVKQNDIGTL